jgi:hypothetical protein
MEFVPEGTVKVIKVVFRAADLPQPVRAGDIVCHDSDTSGGHHVCLRDHTADTVPAPGESNENFHYAYSQAILSRTLTYKEQG